MSNRKKIAIDYNSDTFLMEKHIGNISCLSNIMFLKMSIPDIYTACRSIWVEGILPFSDFAMLKEFP